MDEYQLGHVPSPVHHVRLMGQNGQTSCPAVIQPSVTIRKSRRSARRHRRKNAVAQAFKPRDANQVVMRGLEPAVPEILHRRGFVTGATGRVMRGFARPPAVPRVFAFWTMSRAFWTGLGTGAS